MSISNRHSILPFTAGKSVAMSEQRLSVVRYKKGKNSDNQKLPNVCASVPLIEGIDIENNLKALLPHIRVMLEDTQDKIVKSLYESSEGSLTSVSDDEISVKACIGFLDSESAGGRLTKELIQKWFRDDLADNLTVYICEKLGFNNPSENQMEQVGKHVKGYEEVFASLAGGATVLQKQQIQGCKKALELLADTESEVAVKLAKRLENMEKPVVIAELLEL